ncbi:MAG: hypothetical protein EOP56_00510 [Sphingobacteriales bacterium]|nr:MAG: hypothetical protein EOP56_00510 [Sphingobacteriales bacterium]
MPERTIAIVVHACDRYELLYQGFAEFFTQRWPLDTRISGYYFLTEEKDYVNAPFKNIKTGRGEWSDRLKRGLEQIPESYILYLQEDMWLDKDVPAEAINGVIDFTLEKQPLLFKLNSSEVYKTLPTDRFISDFRLAKLDNQKSEYLMSHQASVWNKDFLMAQLEPCEHPWRNERKGTKRLRKLNPDIYHIDLLSENGKPPVNDNKPSARLSGYCTVSVNASLNEFAPKFIGQLKTTGDSEKMIYAGKLQYNFDHQLTHDGKPKPRKESLIKKLLKKFSS